MIALGGGGGKGDEAPGGWGAGVWCGCGFGCSWDTGSCPSLRHLAALALLGRSSAVSCSLPPCVPTLSPTRRTLCLPAATYGWAPPPSLRSTTTSRCESRAYPGGPMSISLPVCSSALSSAPQGPCAWAAACSLPQVGAFGTAAACTPRRDMHATCHVPRDAMLRWSQQPPLTPVLRTHYQPTNLCGC